MLKKKKKGNREKKNKKKKQKRLSCPYYFGSLLVYFYSNFVGLFKIQSHFSSRSALICAHSWLLF